MEKVIFFLDYANINRSAEEEGIELDYLDLLNYIGEGRFLVDAHCYVPRDPRNEHRVDQEIETLWKAGYIVNSKLGSIAGDTYKCNFDIEITIDVLKVVYQVKPDIIVLGTGDGDFLPLVKELRKLGIRVEIASFENSASRDMILTGSGFISMNEYWNRLLMKVDESESQELVNENEIGSNDTV